MSAGKILFVEDELSKNVPNLLRLFEKYLSVAEKKSLEKIHNDPDGFGATNEDVKAIFKDNPFIDIEHTFPGALKAVSEKYDHYLLFIVDRNLSKSPPELADIQIVRPSFSEDMYIKYLEREGDYLLELLATKGVNCCDSFYFMTAFGKGEALRNEDAISTLISFDAFKHGNFLEKGKKEDFIRLRDEIINIPQIWIKFRDVFEVFEKGWLDNKFRKGLADAIKNMDNWQKKNIDDNALIARQILESIYDTLVDNGLIPENIYNNKQGKFWTLREEDGELSMRTIIEHLKWKKELSGVQIPAAEFTYSMASKIVHWIPGRPEPSKYSNHALVYGLCDSILWFKSKMIEQGC